MYLVHLITLRPQEPKAPGTQGLKNPRTQELKNIGQPKGEKQVYRYAGTQVHREKKSARDGFRRDKKIGGAGNFFRYDKEMRLKEKGNGKNSDHTCYSVVKAT